MGRKYKQLSQNDRISMETLLNKGHSVQEVADYLHVHIRPCFVKYELHLYEMYAKIYSSCPGGFPADKQ